MFHIVGGAIDIIQAEGLPPGKMSILITIRIAATICTRARPSQPDIDTLHRPPVSGASSGSLLASKPGSFLPSAEGGFDQRDSWPAKVRNVSSVGSQSKTSRLHAICLISLRAFQTFPLDRPYFDSDPGLDSNSLIHQLPGQTNRRRPTNACQLPDPTIRKWGCFSASCGFRNDIQLSGISGIIDMFAK